MRGWRSGSRATISANWAAARAISGDQCAEFPQAVARDIAGGDHLAHRLPALAHHVQAGDAHGQDGGLGVDGVVQLLLGSFEAEPAQPETEDVVGPPENPTGGLGYLIEGLPHAHVLRALAGEHEGDRASTVWGDHADVRIRRRTPSP